MRKKLKSLPYSGYDNKDVMDIRTLVKSIKFSCNDLAIARKRMEKAGSQASLLSDATVFSAPRL